MPWFPGDFRCRGDTWGRNANGIPFPPPPATLTQGYCYVNDDKAHRYCLFCLVTFIFPADFNWQTQWVDVTLVSENTAIVSYKPQPAGWGLGYSGMQSGQGGASGSGSGWAAGSSSQQGR